MLIGIHPDDYGSPSGPRYADAASPRWSAYLEEAGHAVRWVDVYRPDILEQLRDCQGFMWRWVHFNGMGQVARRLLPVLENYLGMVVYPDQKTCWHYDDKVAQSYLLNACDIPAPRTWVLHDANKALKWCEKATYPVVVKLATGAGSENVRLIYSEDDAAAWIHRLFGHGTVTLSEGPEVTRPQPYRLANWLQRIRSGIKLTVTGIPPLLPLPTPPSNRNWELHKNYVLFQEFLPDNPFDTRVTVIGNRAFGFRRWNRDQDFRASGSGKLDYNPDEVGEDFIRLAFAAAKQLETQSCAIDGLRRGNDPVVGEVSYTYVSKAVYDCPGHWELDGPPAFGELRWIGGHMWPEKAQIEDFLNRLEHLQR